MLGYIWCLISAFRYILYFNCAMVRLIYSNSPTLTIDAELVFYLNNFGSSGLNITSPACSYILQNIFKALFSKIIKSH